MRLPRHLCLAGTSSCSPLEPPSPSPLELSNPRVHRHQVLRLSTATCILCHVASATGSCALPLPSWALLLHPGLRLCPLALWAACWVQLLSSEAACSRVNNADCNALVGAQAPPDPTAAAEIEALAAAYGLVADPRTRFTHFFLNVVPEAHLRQRPPQVRHAVCS